MKAETFTPKPTVYCDPRANRLFNFLQFALLSLIFIYIAQGVFRQMNGDTKSLFPLWMVVIGLISKPAITYVVAGLFPTFWAPGGDESFLHRARDLFAVTGCKVWRIEVNEPGTEPQAAELYLSSGILTVSRKAIKTISARAMDFGIAEAAANRPLKPVAVPAIGLIPALLLTIPLRVFLLRFYSAREVANWIVWGDLLLLAVFGVALFFNFRGEEERRVRRALELVPSRESATAWVENSIPYGQGIDTQDKLDAYRAKKVKLINQVADELGLP